MKGLLISLSIKCKGAYYNTLRYLKLNSQVESSNFWETKLRRLNFGDWTSEFGDLRSWISEISEVGQRVNFWDSNFGDRSSEIGDCSVKPLIAGHKFLISRFYWLCSSFGQLAQFSQRSISSLKMIREEPIWDTTYFKTRNGSEFHTHVRSFNLKPLLELTFSSSLKSNGECPQ